MGLFLLTIGMIAGVMFVMAIGVLVSGRCLRGSCGGPAVLDPGGDPIRCAGCPRRAGAADAPAAAGDRRTRAPAA